jgi:hypothetical protein
MSGCLRDEKLAPAIISGSFGGAPPEGVEHSEWKRARQWHEALVRHGATVPGDMKGINKLLELRKFESLLLPLSLYYPFLLRRHDPAAIPAMKATAEEKLSDYLREHGF